MTSLSINEATTSFDEVKTALNGYFATRRNIIVELAQFNRRRQNPGEFVDTFIQDLYRIAENCEIPNLADLSDPLRQYYEKKVFGFEVNPSKKTSAAFEPIKQAVVSPTVLAHYKPNCPMIISADASNTGTGAVLFQVQDDGECCPVGYMSRSLSDTEKRYVTLKRKPS